VTAGRHTVGFILRRGDVFEAFTAGEKSLGCGIFEFPTFEFPLN
jgi:hypothetical protein